MSDPTSSKEAARAYLEAQRTTQLAQADLHAFDAINADVWFKSKAQRRRPLVAAVARSMRAEIAACHAWERAVEADMDRPEPFGPAGPGYEPRYPGGWPGVSQAVAVARAVLAGRRQRESLTAVASAMDPMVDRGTLARWVRDGGVEPWPEISRT